MSDGDAGKLAAPETEADGPTLVAPPLPQAEGAAAAQVASAAPVAGEGASEEAFRVEAMQVCVPWHC